MSRFPNRYCVKKYETHLWDPFCFKRSDIVRCYCRTRKDCDSGEVIPANHEHWSTKTKRSKRITLRPHQSHRAIAVTDLAAQVWWFRQRMVCQQRIIRALRREGPLHYSCAGIARRELGNWTKKLGL